MSGKEQKQRARYRQELINSINPLYADEFAKQLDSIPDRKHINPKKKDK